MTTGTDTEIFAAILGALDLPVDYPLTRATKIETIPGWDSLGWVSVVTSIEEMTGREFPIANIEGIVTLDDLINTL